MFRFFFTHMRTLEKKRLNMMEDKSEITSRRWERVGETRSGVGKGWQDTVRLADTGVGKRSR